MLFRGVISCRSFCAAAESLVIVGVVFFFCSYSACVNAGQVTLAWDANTESTLGGYQLQYGQTSGNYTANIDVGNKTSYTLASLQDGATYYFALKAHDTTGTIWSDFSNEVSATITSTGAPTANFSANPTSGVAPLTVTFADSSTGTISTRSWDFGDGSPTSTATSGAKTYSTPGTYTMKLTVTGQGGSSTATKTISATAAAPVANFTASPTSGTGGSPAGLVAAYNFEEAGGATVVDASGKGNHGIIRGAKRVRKGKFGKALSVDGVNDWVTVNDSASLDLRTGMTLEAWVYPTEFTSGWRTVMHKEVDRYYLMAGSERDTPAGGGTYTSGNQDVHAGSSLPVNTWTHLAVTYNSATVRLYVNGTRVASQPQRRPLTTSTGALRIGGTRTYGEYFKGWIDNVRIYNRSLRATEIESDMNKSVRTSSP